VDGGLGKIFSNVIRRRFTLSFIKNTLYLQFLTLHGCLMTLRLEGSTEYTVSSHLD
jgi:hypothetical protein